ncbi:MmgE/PrpD family protein [Microbacterium sp. No. 7]|uniref:MmgE/PrpD family protein n=1 Tax=Microbacterium sp. No. 7 TaxID=1714373 RepID=UPI0006D113E9|nr:MmgE/PrpD family protein [Microbacterium sp. No. 7]ALJ20481.1 2-methylcitrate dehydratase [Microbacterium sp. No. 7]
MNAQQANGPTARLAAHVANVANASLDARDVEAVRRLLLDNCIVSLWGATRPVAIEIADWTRRFAGSGSSPVLGREWTTEASVAALAHGTASHGFELDDTHNATASHPGSVIISSALAVAAEPGPPVESRHLLQAIAAGNEAMALIGIAAGGMSAVHRGLHPTALYGAYGSAATTLTLRALRRGERMDAGPLTRAWGHALSQPSGLMQFSAEPTGGEVKRVHAGLGAHNGIRSADFAALPSVTAPRLVVEGAYGLAAVLAGPLAEIDLGGELQIHRFSLKPYACCRLFHSTIDALREATDGFALPVDAIADILVSGPTLVAEQHMTAAESTMTAQYSCPYVVGATLAYGPYAYEAYDEDHLRDPRIRAVADRVRFAVDAELEAAHYPEHFASAVRLTLTDGSVRSALVVDSIGTAERPLTVAQIAAKGDGLAAHGLAGAGGRLVADIWSDADDAAALIAPLQRESLLLASARR